MKTKCKKCGKDLELIGKHYRCEDCDTYCDQCGNFVKESDKKCKHCGAKFDEVEEESNKYSKPLSKSTKKILMFIGIIIALIILGFIVKATIFTCPSSCDDGIKCTSDFCSAETKYKCDHKEIIPCVGNSKCEQGEFGTTDCPSCDDSNKCTKDSINYDNLVCSHEPIIPCCGNGKPESGETCSSCPQDISCSYGTICCSDKCINPTCFNDENCDDNKDYTLDSCSSPNSCYSRCVYTETTECKTGDNFCPKNCNYKNDGDCLSKYLSETKYTIEDIKRVRTLAQQYKFENPSMSNSVFSNQYLVKSLSLDYTAYYYGYSMGTDTETIDVWALTPFYSAVTHFTSLEETYTDYTDMDIAEILISDSFLININWGSKTLDEVNFDDLGKFNSVVLKKGTTIYKPNKVEHFGSGTRGHSASFEYYKLNNETVNIVLIGTKGEKIITNINLNKYR